MKKEKLTDEDIRMDFLVECGWRVSDARQYIKNNPKPQTIGESSAIANQRFKELGEVIYTGFKLDKLMDKIFRRFK